MKINKLPPIEVLRDYLEYDPESGDLIWLRRPSLSVRVGDIAGCRRKKGYTQVRLLGSVYFAHRVCWALYYGEDPYPNLIDHKEGHEKGNGIANLRLASDQDNAYNRKKQCNNTSGHRGVMWNKQEERWRAYIKINGKLKHLGMYDLMDEAIAARLKAEEENNIFVRD